MAGLHTQEAEPEVVSLAPVCVQAVPATLPEAARLPPQAVDVPESQQTPRLCPQTNNKQCQTWKTSGISDSDFQTAVQRCTYKD